MLFVPFLQIPVDMLPASPFPKRAKLHPDMGVNLYVRLTYSQKKKWLRAIFIFFTISICKSVDILSPALPFLGLKPCLNESFSLSETQLLVY